MVRSFLLALIESRCAELFTELMSKMKSFEQRKYLNAAIAFITKQYLASDTVEKDDTTIVGSKTISDAASLFQNMVKDNDILKDHLVSSLTRSTIPPLDDSLSARRSVIAALVEDEGHYTAAFDLSCADESQRHCTRF